VQFTSGTTARPKGVVWNHANVLWGARLAAVNMRLTSEDVSLVHFPLCHTNALMYAHLGSLWAGASFVLVPKFSASRFWDVALAYGCTWTSTSPFVLHALSQHPVPDQHRFRFWGTGTTDLPECQNTFHVKSLGWWGMTETLAFGLVGDLDLPGTPLATGRPALGYEIAVVGERGDPVAYGESGRLLIRGIRGVSLFAEYLDDPEATAAAFDEDGWFDTGDIATPLDDGYIRFEGRAKDMLRVGGENVAAAEIERAVASLPHVAEVAVVAAPHAMLEEVPVAFVIPREGFQLSADDVTGRCRSLLADFKVPRHVVFVTDLPRSTTDKVAKAELRRRLQSGMYREVESREHDRRMP
jgi:carnitine-CoA ligase